MKFSKKNINIIRTIWKRIYENKTIIITRHIRPDGDAVGSCCGLAQILKDNFNDKNIYVINSDYSDTFSFIEEKNNQVNEEIYKNALVIVTDTATPERISDKNYSKAKEIIKIDHHPNLNPYGSINLIEDFRASASELIVKLWYFSEKKLKLSPKSATMLYTGIVTDTNRFLFNPKNECLMYSSILLERGAEAELIYNKIYLKPFSYLNYQSYILNLVKKTEYGTVYIILEENDQKKLNLSYEESSECINIISNISECPIYIAFIYNSENKNYRVRLRAREIDISDIGIKYHGGGHKFASGATVKNKSEIIKLLNDADNKIRNLNLH